MTLQQKSVGPLGPRLPSAAIAARSSRPAQPFSAVVRTIALWALLLLAGCGGKYGRKVPDDMVNKLT